jgi:NADP-dependent 3-hydroxy acid dehydrogenase YdfG
LERQGHDVNLGLTGRVVVTGDSSGIGLATVESLVEEGAQVATCARNPARLAAAVGHFDPTLALEQGCNVRDRTACQEFVTAGGRPVRASGRATETA